METGRGQGRQGQTLTEHSEPEVGPDGPGEQTGQVQGPRTYVDRVVQEILDTERTYVQDLRSIVEVRNHHLLLHVHHTKLCKDLHLEFNALLAFFI